MPRVSLPGRARGAVQRWALRRQGRDQLPLQLAPRRIYIVPTTAGWNFALLIGAMFVAGMNYGNGLVLLLTFYMARPVEFSTFPSLLLIATLFRLSLNVAATRLILSDGDAGRVIGAIGAFVVGGNYVIGLIVFMTLFTMSPVLQKVNHDAFEPFMAGKLSMEDGYGKGMAPLREFMVRQTREQDLALMIELSKAKPPQGMDDISNVQLVPGITRTLTCSVVHL
jgi:hypothetical protein